MTFPGQSKATDNLSGERISRLRIGIIGAGVMGRLHARTVARLADTGENCVLAAVMDRHLGRAEAVAQDFGSTAFTDIGGLLDEIDAAIVCVPPGAHFSMVKRVFEQDCDVLVEKPLAASVSEARSLAELAHVQKRILQVGHVEWYNQGWREAVAVVGVPKTIEVERLSLASDRGLELDVIQDLLLHDLDWVMRLLDEEVIEITAHGSRILHDKLDEVEANLVFRSGCRVRLRASRVSKKRRRIVRISGDQGVATGDLQKRRRTDAPSETEFPQDPLEAQCRDFFHAVRSREKPNADAWIGVAVLEMVDRVRDAIVEA